MEMLVNFLLTNYVWFLIISLILIFSLIGYLVDSLNPPQKKEAIRPIAPVKEEKTIVTHPSVEVYTNDEFDEPLIKDKNA